MKRIVFLFSFLSIQLTAFSQLGVGTNSPDASAQLDVEATDKGFLAPRIALTSATDVLTIASPATGLMVYNTATAGTSPNNVFPGYYYYNGTRWSRFVNTALNATVSFNTADPNTGTPTFTPNTPQSTDYIYVSSVNSSLWVWNGSAYVSYAAPGNTPFYKNSTTTDAGGDKTSGIYRTGSIGIGTNNTTRLLDVVNTASSYAGLIEAEGVVSNSYSRAFAIRMRRGTSASPTALQLNDVSAYGFAGHDGTSFSTTSAGMAGIATENWTSSAKGMGLIFSTTQNATTTLVERMRIDHLGFVGIGTSSPSAPLEVSSAGVGALIRRSSSGLAASNLILQKTASSDPAVNTALANNDYIGRILFSSANGTNYSLNGTDIVGYAVGAQTTTNNGGGIFFRTVPQNSVAQSIERMRIEHNGNVGIGTSVPLTTLHVQNSILATNSINANANVLRLSRGSTAGVKWDNIAQFNLGSYNASNSNASSRLDLALTNGGDNTTLSNIMTWQANGNVGIGTTAPITNLDVVGGFNLRNTIGAGGSNYGIEFNTNANAPRIDWVFNGAYIGQFTSDANDFQLRNSKLSTGGFRFFTNPSGSQVERMTILNNGNVGIGTTSPVTPLHIVGAFTEDITSQDNFSNGINIRKRGNSSAATGAVASGAEIGYHSFSGWNGTGYVRGAYAFASAAENFTATANGTNYAIFTTANGTTANVERFKIMHNGNVGIGTGTPNGGLTLYGPASLALPVNIQGSGGPTKELVFGRGGLTAGFAAITGVDNGQYGGGLSFIVKPTGTDNFPTNAIQAMVLDWNGNMGLGTGSPTQRLDVNGRVRIRTIDTGVATDSVLVVNGGVVKRVSKGASVNIQTANYTLTASDNGNIVIMNSATAVTVTVPATLPAGFVVQIIQKGAGQVTVSGSGSTINSANGFKTRVTNSAIGIVMESSTVGYVTGDSNF